MNRLILVYSETNDRNIAGRIGLPEYSYYFVLRAFLPVLRELGEVRVVYDPVGEADALHDEARAAGRECVLLSFAPPHRTLLPQRCPTIPMIAWEFDRIPDHAWDGHDFHDWRVVLNRCGKAITHSEFARRAFQRALASGFPIWSIPAPIWDRFSSRALERQGDQGRVPARGVRLDVRGLVFDTRNPGRATIGFRPKPGEHFTEKAMRKAARWRRRFNTLAQRLGGGPEPRVTRLNIDGVVFATIFNPSDGRKNWGEMVTAFVAAFKDVEDATLILKLNETDSHVTFASLAFLLRKFPDFRCRIIGFNGYLEEADYDAFLDGIDYVVNASSGEGQCLPLMELMSMGVPALAPDHSSMADYVTPDNAFVLRSSAFLTSWPHDDRGFLTTHAYRVDWDGLRDAYLAAYSVARHDERRYREMSKAARQGLEQHCSVSQVRRLLQQALSEGVPTSGSHATAGAVEATGSA